MELQLLEWVCHQCRKISAAITRQRRHAGEYRLALNDFLWLGWRRGERYFDDRSLLFPSFGGRSLDARTLLVPAYRRLHDGAFLNHRPPPFVQRRTSSSVARITPPGFFTPPATWQITFPDGEETPSDAPGPTSLNTISSLPPLDMPFRTRP
jgi:hypothetical protein